MSILKCPCRVLQTACSEQEKLCGTSAWNHSLLPPVSWQISFSYFSLQNVNLCLYRLSHSPSLCLSSWANSMCVNINASSNLPCTHSLRGDWFSKELSPHHSTAKLWASLWSDPLALSLVFSHYILACLSAWQQHVSMATDRPALDSSVFGHVALLQAFTRSLGSRTAEDNQYFLRKPKEVKTCSCPCADTIHHQHPSTR